MAPHVRNNAPAVAVLAAVAAVITIGAARGSSPPAHRPDRDDVVLARVPAVARDPRARRQRALERQLAGDPGDLGVALALARLHIEEARRRGDPRPTGYAQAALAPWWAAAVPPPPVLLLRATILQSRHDFDRALDDLDRLVAVAPGEPQAWLTRAVVLAVRGRYAEARASCDRLTPLAAPLVVRLCAAPLAGLTGRVQAARQMVAEIVPAAVAPADRAWALSVAGELASWAGDAIAAERQLAEALRLDPDDRYARTLLADLLLDGGRPGEAAALVAGREADDGMLLRRALAEAQRGGAQAPALAAELRARFAASRLRGEAVHQREEARLALAVDRDGPRALALAEEGWRLQHEPWDARLLLESAVAAARPSAAAPALAWLEETGFEQPRLRALAVQLRRGGR